MSASEQLPLTAARRHLGLTYQTFHRWRQAAGLPRKGYYSVTELRLLEAVGDYLAEDRSLTRAAQHINQLLGV